MYNKDNYRRIRLEFTRRRTEAENRQHQRLAHAENTIEGIAEINAALSQTHMRIFGTFRGGSEGIEERIEKLHKENDELLAVREDLLVRAGYPRDYLTTKYECEICRDYGYIQNGEVMCSCFKRALVLAGYESSGIGTLMRTQTFESFSLDYFKDPADRAQMAQNLEIARSYAQSFSTDTPPENLFLFGATGLGKTHLSTAIAKTVIDRGYDVVYETAINVFSDFEDDRFRRDLDRTRDPADGKRTDRYFDCELLIVDDLGVEMATQYTASCLYDLINSRSIAGKSCILSTNLSHAEIERRYTRRVLSRLLGEYRQLHFVGSDVRMEKMRT